MARAKQTRAKTGCARRRALRNVQEQYRHTDGLNSLQVQTRTSYQYEMAHLVDLIFIVGMMMT
jgi:hypothetical protein